MKLNKKSRAKIFDLHLGLTFDWRETGILRWRILLWKDGRCVLKAEISGSVTAAVQAVAVWIALSKNYMKNTRKREKIS